MNYNLLDCKYFYLFHIGVNQRVFRIYNVEDYLAEWLNYTVKTRCSLRCRVIKLIKNCFNYLFFLIYTYINYNIINI